MARRQRRRRAAVTGLTWRGDYAYYQRSHVRLPKGRVNKSLHTEDAEQAAIRAGALNTLAERGDWPVIARWAADELHITDLVAAVREGEYRKLRQLNREGLPLRRTADSYLSRVEATLGKRTREKYGQVVDAAVAHFGAEKRMHEVSTADAEGYLHAPKESAGGQPWAPHTQAAHRNALGALWRFAMEREHEESERAGAAPSLTTNPWRKAKAPRLRRTRFSYLTPKEARALLDHEAVRDTPARALLAIVLHGGGLRLSELAHLRTDVDVVLTDKPSSSWVIVQARDGEHEWRPKTDRGERRLRTIPALHAILVEHRRRYAGDRFFFPPEGKDCPPNLSTIRRWVMAAFEAAGISYGRKGDALTLHSLRHTYVTWQLMARVPLPTVAKRAGDSPEVILQVYAHIMPESDDEADKALQRIAEGEA